MDAKQKKKKKKQIQIYTEICVHVAVLEAKCTQNILRLNGAFSCINDENIFICSQISTVGKAIGLEV